VIRLGGLEVLSLLVQMTHVGLNRLGQVFGDVFGGESWPCGEVAVPNSFEERCFGRAEATGMEVMDEVGYGGCGGDDVGTVEWVGLWRNIRDNGCCVGDGPQPKGGAMSDHDGLVFVNDAGLVAFENDLAAVVGENSNGEESVVSELGEDVSFLGGGGQHVKAWDCTGVGGVDFAAVREGNADAEVGRYRDRIGAR
jgi:hypothetical protein